MAAGGSFFCLYHSFVRSSCCATLFGMPDLASETLQTDDRSQIYD